MAFSLPDVMVEMEKVEHFKNTDKKTTVLSQFNEDDRHLVGQIIELVVAISKNKKIARINMGLLRKFKSCCK